MAEKKLRNEKTVIGSLGRGAVGYPSSSTSGRVGPSSPSVTDSSGDKPRTELLMFGRCREIGGGTASSSPSVSSPIGASVSAGRSECSRQKRKKLSRSAWAACRIPCVILTIGQRDHSSVPPLGRHPDERTSSELEEGNLSRVEAASYIRISKCLSRISDANGTAIRRYTHGTV